MPQENVEIVMGLLPAPEVDFVSLFRDDRTAARSAEPDVALVAPQDRPSTFISKYSF